jgi:tetratricopeptide (TPR) repeat protein
MKAWCVACVMLVATAARADDLDRARQLYEDGVARYDAGDYAEAIRAWQASYTMSPAPLLLFNMGQAYRLSGNCARAMEHYDRYVRAVPNPDNRNELDQALESCRATLARPSKLGSASPFTLPAAPSTHRTRRLVGYVVGGGGIALGGIAVLAALDGRRLSSLEQNVATWTPTDNANQRRGRLDNALAWSFAGAGAVAVGVGVALVVTSRSTERAIAVVPTPGGGAVAVSGRF